MQSQQEPVSLLTERMKEIARQMSDCEFADFVTQLQLVGLKVGMICSDLPQWVKDECERRRNHEG